jgi:hypothetical protein
MRICELSVRTQATTLDGGKLRLAHGPARVTQALLMGVVGSGCAQRTSDEMVGLSAAPVIYGADDRIELFEAPQPARGLLQDALVALVPASRMRVLAVGSHEQWTPVSHNHSPRGSTRVTGDSFATSSGAVHFADQVVWSDSAFGGGGSSLLRSPGRRRCS